MKCLFILSICVYLCLGQSIPSIHQKWPGNRSGDQTMTINPDGTYHFAFRDPGKEYRAEIGFFRPWEKALTVQGFFIIRQSDGQWQIQIYQADRNGTKILLSDTSPRFPVVPHNLVGLYINLYNLIPKSPTRFYN
ncbi:hypothetical protein ACFFRR_004633 [Megaselia abdita]